MFLKVCELVPHEGDYGRRFHLFEDVSDVVYDEFFRFFSREEFNKLVNTNTRLLMFNGTKTEDPVACCRVSFLDSKGRKQNILFDTNAYLCNDSGKTVCSFPTATVQNPTFSKNSAKKRATSTFEVLGLKNIDKVLLETKKIVPTSVNEKGAISEAAHLYAKNRLHNLSSRELREKALTTDQWVFKFSKEFEHVYAFMQDQS